MSSRRAVHRESDMKGDRQNGPRTKVREKREGARGTRTERWGARRPPTVAREDRPSCAQPGLADSQVNQHEMHLLRMRRTINVVEWGLP